MRGKALLFHCYLCCSFLSFSSRDPGVRVKSVTGSPRSSAADESEEEIASLLKEADTAAAERSRPGSRGSEVSDSPFNFIEDMKDKLAHIPDHRPEEVDEGKLGGFFQRLYVF